MQVQKNKKNSTRHRTQRPDHLFASPRFRSLNRVLFVRSAAARGAGPLLAALGFRVIVFLENPHAGVLRRQRLCGLSLMNTSAGICRNNIQQLWSIETILLLRKLQRCVCQAVQPKPASQTHTRCSNSSVKFWCRLILTNHLFDLRNTLFKHQLQDSLPGCLRCFLDH